MSCFIRCLFRIVTSANIDSNGATGRYARCAEGETMCGKARKAEEAVDWSEIEATGAGEKVSEQGAEGKKPEGGSTFAVDVLAIVSANRHPHAFTQIQIFFTSHPLPFSPQLYSVAFQTAIDSLVRWIEPRACPLAKSVL